MEFEQDKRTTCAAVKCFMMAERSLPCLCTCGASLVFGLRKKSFADQWCCLSWQFLDSIRSWASLGQQWFLPELEQPGSDCERPGAKDSASLVAMRRGWRSFGKARWVFYFLCTLTHAHTLTFLVIFWSNSKSAYCFCVFVFLFPNWFPFFSFFFFNGRVFNYQNSNKKVGKKQYNKDARRTQTAWWKFLQLQAALHTFVISASWSMRIFSRFFWASGLILRNGSRAGIVSFSVFDFNGRYVVSDKWHVISGTESFDTTQTVHHPLLTLRLVLQWCQWLFPRLIT